MDQSCHREIYLAERQGLAPVSPSLRRGGLWPIFSIFCNSLLNPATLVTSGLMIVAGLPLWVVVGVQTLAVVTGMLPFLVLAQVGIQEGIPGQVFCRAVFGHRGSRWLTSPLRIICSIYWYAFQTIASMMAVESILLHSFGYVIPLGWLAAGFSAIQGIVALLGYGGVSRLSEITLPFKIFAFLILAYWLVQNGGTPASFGSVTSFQTDSWEWTVGLAWVNGIFSSMLSLVTDAADFSRYTRKSWHLKAGVVGGVLIGTAAGSLFGGWCVISGGVSNINPFSAIVELNPGGGILLLILLVTVLDAWTINVINLYTGGFSLANSIEALGRLTATGLVIVVATALSLLPDIVHSYIDILSAAGALFGPVCGALLGWSWCYRNNLDVPSLYKCHGPYWYWRGWNLMTCLPILPLAVLALWLPAACLPAVWSCLISFALVCITSWFIKQPG